MPKKSIAVTEKSVNVNSPKELVEFATTLKTFIVKQKLYTNIKGKNYVNVEGWQYAGASTGITPIVETLDRVATEEQSEIKYLASVKLVRITDGEIVGRGIALCSSKEYNRKGNDEYVIASMAQTRATGKAYRNTFAWLMKMAGYEATPAEEMNGDVVEEKKEIVEIKGATKPASAAQVATIKSLGGIVEEPLTKEEASHAIKELLLLKKGK